MQPYYDQPDHVLVRSDEPEDLISLETAKHHLRVDHTDDDTKIEALIAAAMSVLDGPKGMVGKALVTQQWTLTQGRLTGKTRLPVPVLPFVTVVSLKYYDAANSQQTADVGSDFITFGGDEFGYVEPRTSWPAMYDRPDALELIFTAGFGAAAAVPQNIVHAALLMICNWYENRSGESQDGKTLEIPPGVEMLVNIDRIGWVKS
jgi:uncharacterized phiE125 gp8 family phage protein